MSNRNLKRMGVTELANADLPTIMKALDNIMLRAGSVRKPKR